MFGQDKRHFYEQRKKEEIEAEARRVEKERELLRERKSEEAERVILPYVLNKENYFDITGNGAYGINLTKKELKRINGSSEDVSWDGQICDVVRKHGFGCRRYGNMGFCLFEDFELCEGWFIYPNIE
jgi:hypothetical protein